MFISRRGSLFGVITSIFTFCMTRLLFSPSPASVEDEEDEDEEDEEEEDEEDEDDKEEDEEEEEKEEEEDPITSPSPTDPICSAG
jgi:hypothetical protein